MQRSSRLIAIIVCLAASAAFGPAHAQERVRMSWNTFEQDQNRVISLLRGVQEMKRRNTAPKDSAAYRTSWEYWAAMHGYLGPTGQSGTVADATARTGPLFAGLYTGMSDLTPPAVPAGLGQEVWEQCTHTFTDDQNVEHRALHFLSWHRMYLYYFERVLRAAAGDPNLTLPYWDYTNEGQLAGPVLFFVPELQGAAGPIANPLFEPRRTPGLGAFTGVLPEITNPDPVLQQPDFEEFQVQLEMGIHGSIHCAIGNGCIGPIMGLVPTSAGDPIFWVHHANIDRLWDCWSKRYGETHNPINDANWMNQSFVFVDETGARVTIQAKDLFGANKRTDYRYERVSDCSRGPLPPPEQSFATRTAFAAVAPARVVEVRNVNITTPEASVPLPVPQSGPRASTFRSAALAGGPRLARAELVLEGIETPSAPGVMYEVSLAVKGLPRSESVGFINFFGRDGGPNAHHGARQTRRFDVTSIVRRLQAQGATGDWLVNLKATSGIAGQRTGFVGERFQATRPTVSIQRIELRVRDAGARANLPAILQDAN